MQMAVQTSKFSKIHSTECIHSGMASSSQTEILHFTLPTLDEILQVSVTNHSSSSNSQKMSDTGVVTMMEIIFHLYWYSYWYDFHTVRLSYRTTFISLWLSYRYDFHTGTIFIPNDFHTGTSSTQFLLWPCFCLHDTGTQFRTSTNHTGTSSSR